MFRVTTLPKPKHAPFPLYAVTEDGEYGAAFFDDRRDAERHRARLVRAYKQARKRAGR